MLGTAYFVIGFLHSLFPRRLPTTVVREPDAEKTVERVISVYGIYVQDDNMYSLRLVRTAYGCFFGAIIVRRRIVADYFSSLKRIMSNRVIFFDALSSVFYSIGLAAYGTFFPKYIESLFQFSPAKSVLILGKYVPIA